MISLTPVLNEEATIPLYRQLFHYIRDAVVNRDIFPGDKLPSLRALSESLNISVTTVELAYDQLLLEGYINSIPRSGYYVSNISYGDAKIPLPYSSVDLNSDTDPARLSSIKDKGSRTYVDPACFDFTKWKNCFNKVINDHSSLLLCEGDIQGEPPSSGRNIKIYLSVQRVRCSLEQVIIAAGTQQLINILCIILKEWASTMYHLKIRLCSGAEHFQGSQFQDDSCTH